MTTILQSHGRTDGGRTDGQTDKRFDFPWEYRAMCIAIILQEAQLLLGDRARESMPRIAEMDVEMTT